MLTRSLALILALLLSACAPRPQFTQATIHGRGQTILLTDLPRVAKLASFFPGVGTGKSSAWGGGWMGRESIDFTQVNGTKSHVIYDYQYRFWSEGRGDWLIEPGLQDYLEALDHAAATQKSASP